MFPMLLDATHQRACFDCSHCRYSVAFFLVPRRLHRLAAEDWMSWSSIVVAVELDVRLTVSLVLSNFEQFTSAHQQTFQHGLVSLAISARVTTPDCIEN
jgi:hypothetical protein